MEVLVEFESLRISLIYIMSNINTFSWKNFNLPESVSKYFEPFKETQFRGFTGRAVVKNPPANAGDTGSSPGPGRSHMLWNN